MYFTSYSAEFAYERFIQEQWNDPSADRLKEARQHDEDQWMSMSPREKSLKWARDHRYQIVFGSWVIQPIVVLPE